MEMKKCKSCNIEFEPTGRNHQRCAPCAKTQAKKKDQKAEKVRWQKSNRFKRTKRVYGVDLDQYNEMFNNQNGCCAICGTHQTDLTRSLAVDHCHSNGNVRGLLCSNCNLMIGHAKDNIDTLLSAICYLNRWVNKKQ